MPVQSVWMLEKANITLSGGASLDGVTQGSGVHLLNRTLTLNTNDWLQTQLDDTDPNFDDTDASQTLSGAQTINGITYANGTRVEAEYTLTLQDPATGLTYRVFGYNVNNSNPAYATIEGLAFFGGAAGFPPVGTALTIIATSEGPANTVNYTQLAYPPCFTPGTRIATQLGARPIEDLQPGDLICTEDAGLQPLLWVGRIDVPNHDLRDAAFRPIRVRAGALGKGLPRRDMLVSPQHRFVISGWRAELLFGAPSVLVAAKHLVNDQTIRPASVSAVTYLHLLLPQHHIIRAEGALTESLHPSQVGRMGAAALPCLSGIEARLLSGAGGGT